MVDVVSVILLVIFAGIGGVAGYLARITQKIEDKRDETYLKDLPGIYSNLTALNDNLQLYSKGGELDNFAKRLNTASDQLRKAIFSANILVFREKLHNDLYGFYQEITNLEEVVKSIQRSTNSQEEQKFKLKLQNGGSYLIADLNCNPKETYDHTKEICKAIRSELKRYKSLSLILIILVFALGALVAVVEIVKGLFNV